MPGNAGSTAEFRVGSAGFAGVGLSAQLDRMCSSPVGRCIKRPHLDSRRLPRARYGADGAWSGLTPGIPARVFTGAAMACSSDSGAGSVAVVAVPR
jgi:hypothetical protein